MDDRISLIQKIGLGTVQFGSDYGIANKRGKVSESEAFEILNFAWEQGINTVDTAAAYWDSEGILGRFFEKSGLNYRVVSKVPAFESKNFNSLKNGLKKTLARLKQEKIYGYLIHKFDDIIEQKSLLSELQQSKKEGFVEKIGFSLYRVEELQYLLDRNIPFDILQIPYNIFDQRFAEYFQSLKNRGVEIHTRSAFLQGLFFLRADELNENMRSARGYLKKLRNISSELGIPIPHLCLCFVLLNPHLDKTIIGVDSMVQLKQNMIFTDYISKTNEIYEQLKGFAMEDEQVILPFLWEQNKKQAVGHASRKAS